MQDSLRQLVEVELVYQRGVLPQAHYTFKHALIQDTAYESLLKRTRQDLHTQIAQVLEEQFPETTQTQPEIIAHHYTEAGLQEQAFGYWQKAGDNARERTADVEAIAHFTKGLAVLKTLPDTPERVQQELTLQLALAEPLQNIKGFASSDVEHVLARAQELCQRVGETPQLFWALYGFMGIYMARAEYQTAYERSSQCLRLAELLQDPPLLLLSHKAQGACLRLLGDLPLAQEHLERALTLYDPQLQPAMAFNKAYCQGELSQVLWFLGYLDQAVVQNDATLTFARQLSHPHDLAYGLFYVAQFYIECGERQAAQELLEEVLSLSTEYGFPMLLSWATLLRGIALALQGQVEEGLAQMEQGVALENEAGGNGPRYGCGGAGRSLRGNGANGKGPGARCRGATECPRSWYAYHRGTIVYKSGLTLDLHICRKNTRQAMKYRGFTAIERKSCK